MLRAMKHLMVLALFVGLAAGGCGKKQETPPAADTAAVTGRVATGEAVAASSSSHSAHGNSAAGSSFT